MWGGRGINLVPWVRNMQAVRLRIERILEVTGLTGVGVMANHGDIVVFAFFSLRFPTKKHPVRTLFVFTTGHSGSVGAPSDSIGLAAAVDELRIVARIDFLFGHQDSAICQGYRHRDWGRVEAIIRCIITLSLSDSRKEGNLP